MLSRAARAASARSFAFANWDFGAWYALDALKALAGFFSSFLALDGANEIPDFFGAGAAALEAAGLAPPNENGDDGFAGAAFSAALGAAGLAPPNENGDDGFAGHC